MHDDVALVSGCIRIFARLQGSIYSTLSGDFIFSSGTDIILYYIILYHSVLDG